jgi:hypothetical protein
MFVSIKRRSTMSCGKCGIRGKYVKGTDKLIVNSAMKKQLEDAGLWDDRSFVLDPRLPEDFFTNGKNKAMKKEKSK